MSDLFNWERREAGHYVSDCGKIEIIRDGRKWKVYVEDYEWGGDYSPFESLINAQDLLDEFRFRGFV